MSNCWCDNCCCIYEWSSDFETTPGKRHSCISWSQDKCLWLFGGISDNVFLSDLWKYDINSDLWHSDFSDGPIERGSSVSWVDKNGCLWLYGGISDSTYLSDLWKYNTQTGFWSDCTTSDPHPGARANGMTWTSDCELWLYGGESDGFYFSDLWKFSIENKTWNVEFPNVIGPRASGISWQDCNKNLWLFGGFDGSNFLSDLWLFSDDDLFSDFPTCPSPRSESIPFVDKNCDLWLFGGLSDSTFLSDLWKFSIYCKRWMDYSDCIHPPFPPVRAYSISWVDSCGNFWLYGGSDEVEERSDFWKLSICCEMHDRLRAVEECCFDDSDDFPTSPTTVGISKKDDGLSTAEILLLILVALLIIVFIMYALKEDDKPSPSY